MNTRLQELIFQHAQPDSHIFADDNGRLCLEIRPSDFINTALVWGIMYDDSKVFVDTFAKVMRDRQLGDIHIDPMQAEWLGQYLGGIADVIHDQQLHINSVAANKTAMQDFVAQHCTGFPV